MTIFTSQRVNLDPEPYVGPTSGERRAEPFEDHGEPAFLDPRPEFEPTRDPFPVEFDGSRFPAFGFRSEKPMGARWAPRREQFDTPVNPILVAFRDTNDDALSWLADWKGTVEWIPDTLGLRAALEIADHAHRVLTGLANFNMNGEMN